MLPESGKPRNRPLGAWIMPTGAGDAQQSFV